MSGPKADRAPATLAGRTALVTGGTGGIGGAVARELARLGCNVIVNGFAHATEIQSLLEELRQASGAEALHDASDLADPDQISGMIEKALTRFGVVDILVNNAVVRDVAPTEAFPPERWDQAIAVNLSSAFHTTRLILPGMRSQNWGRIINMSSVYGLFACRDRIAYVTTKTALLGMTRAVALETSEQEITCNAICPGTVNTPAIESKIQALANAEGLEYEAAAQRYLADRQPGGRFVDAERIAGLAGFLCSDAGLDITGAALPVDRGWLAS